MTLFSQIARFVITGSINTIFGYMVYVFGILVLDMTYVQAVLLAYVLGTTFSYLMFRAFVFTVGDRGWKSYARFMPVYIVMLLLNLFTMHILVDLMNWNKFLAQALVAGVCAVLSFTLNRAFIFKNKRP